MLRIHYLESGNNVISQTMKALKKNQLGSPVIDHPSLYVWLTFGQSRELYVTVQLFFFFLELCTESQIIRGNAKAGFRKP